MGARLLGLEEPGVTLEVALHLGTLVSILVYYRRRVTELTVGLARREPEAVRYAGSILLGSVPAAAAYAVFDKKIEAAFESPAIVGALLCVTGLILLSTVAARRAERPLSYGRAFGIGCAQACALLPGISRSGATVVAARHAGVGAAKAAEFSLLLGAVAMTGAAVVKLAGPGAVAGSFPASRLLFGAAVSGVVGYVAIAWLVRALASGRLWLFGIYCLASGGLGLALFL